MLDGPQIDPRALRNAFGCFASGVTVITMRDDAGRATGVTVSSFSSLSLEPALCLFSLDKRQVSCKGIEAGHHFNINVLGAEQGDIAWQFAKPADDKCAGVAMRDGRNGVPLIDGAIAHFECTKWNVMDGGDHIIVVGEITDFAEAEGAPLLFYRGQMALVSE